MREIDAIRPAGRTRRFAALLVAGALVTSGCWRSTSGRELRPPTGAPAAVVAPPPTTVAPVPTTAAADPTTTVRR